MTAKGYEPVLLEILEYLDRHPEAQDTLEGIVEWWLLETRIQRAFAEVKTAIAELVELGFIKAVTTRKSVHYKVNPKKKREIARFMTGKIEPKQGRAEKAKR